MRIDVVSGLAVVPPNEWDALAGSGSPFLEWGWLASLEEAGCVGADSGWVPQHLLLRDGARLLGACPLYVKTHSQGEFVFDHGWAEAAHRGGIDYYPKLLVAAPFTPATGVRFLSHPDADRPTVVRALAGALREVCDRQGFSSVHVNFCMPDEAVALAPLGFLERTRLPVPVGQPGLAHLRRLSRRPSAASAAHRSNASAGSSRPRASPSPCTPATPFPSRCSRRCSVSTSTPSTSSTGDAST